jgi:hypothetical protein
MRVSYFPLLVPCSYIDWERYIFTYGPILNLLHPHCAIIQFAFDRCSDIASEKYFLSFA